MYQKIIVPLDGSKLAETILPHVEELAKDNDAREIVLVSVTERVVVRTAAPEVREVYGGNVPITIGKKQSQAQRYLDRIARRMAKKGISVMSAVLLGDPAHEITVFAEENGSDLIAMTGHGNQVRAILVPVLVVKSTSGT